MKYLLQADWERLVRNAERYEALASIVVDGGSAAERIQGLPRGELDAKMDAAVEGQADASRRASGDSICATCNRAYRLHPKGGPIGCGDEQFLNRLCSGSLVKL